MLAKLHSKHPTRVLCELSLHVFLFKQKTILENCPRSLPSGQGLRGVRLWFSCRCCWMAQSRWWHSRSERSLAFTDSCWANVSCYDMLARCVEALGWDSLIRSFWCVGVSSPCPSRRCPLRSSLQLLVCANVSCPGRRKHVTHLLATASN